MGNVLWPIHSSQVPSIALMAPCEYSYGLLRPRFMTQLFFDYWAIACLTVRLAAAIRSMLDLDWQTKPPNSRKYETNIEYASLVDLQIRITSKLSKLLQSENKFNTSNLVTNGPGYLKKGKNFMKKFDATRCGWTHATRRAWMLIDDWWEERGQTVHPCRCSDLCRLHIILRMQDFF